MKPGKIARLVCMAAATALASCSKPQATYSVVERSASDIAADLASGKVTSEALVTAYEDRIKAEDGKLKAVLALSPKAIEAARESDARRKAGKPLSPLDGVPILIKDNIDFAGMPTTAGSLALKDNVPAKNAPMVQRLVDGGVVILGKANLSE